MKRERIDAHVPAAGEPTGREGGSPPLFDRDQLSFEEEVQFDVRCGSPEWIAYQCAAIRRGYMQGRVRDVICTKFLPDGTVVEVDSETGEVIEGFDGLEARIRAGEAMRGSGRR